MTMPREAVSRKTTSRKGLRVAALPREVTAAFFIPLTAREGVFTTGFQTVRND